MSKEFSEISKWYARKGILITGATGFMGKVLVEKLLRSCPESGPIYLLVRQKKDVLPSLRVKEMLSSVLFENVRSYQMNLHERLFAISGDLTEPGLGLSEEDTETLLSNVSVVFHVGGTVRFNESLRSAIRINCVGTKSLLEFCGRMDDVKAIVHVSTAFAHPVGLLIEERTYPHYNMDEIIDWAMHCDDDEPNVPISKLLYGYMNTYAYSKALTENVVERFAKDLPIVIVRPSIVVASLREPVPGWIDSYGGLAGVLVAAKIAGFRYVYGSFDVMTNLIPVDVCINLFVAAAWETGTRGSSDQAKDKIRVYNCVVESNKSLTSARALALCSQSMALNKSRGTWITPSIAMTNSKLTFILLNSVYCTIPAIVMDIFMWLLGRKPKFYRIQQRTYNMLSLVTGCLERESIFTTNHMKQLREKLTSIDKIDFDFNIDDIVWGNYMNVYYRGICKYLLNEDVSNFPIVD